MGKAYIKSYILAISCFLSLLVISIFFNGDQRFEELAMGRETFSYFAKEGGDFIHVAKLREDKLQPLYKGWERRGKRPVFLTMGNSQTHSINQMKAGEVTFPELLFHELDSSGIDYLTMSVINGNLQEFYLYYAYLKQYLPIKKVIIPAFFDDMREDDVRPFFFEQLVDEQFQLSGSSNLDIKINKVIQAAAAPEEKQGEKTELAATIQETTETYLNERLAENFKIWENRGNVRGNFFNTMYKLRNTVFRISAQSKRQVIPAVYKRNKAALLGLLSSIQSDGAKAVLYIPPLRNDVEIPYVKSSYKKFKDEMKTVASTFPNTQYANLEGVIPGSFWGIKESTNLSGKPEYDFMHFQYQGHKNLAKALLPFLQN